MCGLFHNNILNVLSVNGVAEFNSNLLN